MVPSEGPTGEVSRTLLSRQLEAVRMGDAGVFGLEAR